MYKTWLLLFPILCCLLSCDALSTGGNPSEGRPCNQKILKVHPELLRFDITMTCPYEKNVMLDWALELQNLEILWMACVLGVGLNGGLNLLILR